MNQLEFFVASTECARSETRRYLRQMRELDERIEYHLDCLRYIAERRVQLLADGEDVEAAEEPSATSGRRRRASPGRHQTAATAAAASSSSSAPAHSDGGSSSPHPHRHELLAGLKRGRPSSVRSGLVDPASTPLSAIPPEELRAAYAFHSRRAMRHAEERRSVAAELAERSAELRGAMAVRLTQFQQSVPEDFSR